MYGILKDCVSIARFPEPQNISDYIFGYHNIALRENSLIGELKFLTSSFNTQELYNYASNITNYDHYYNYISNNAYIHSLYDNAKSMFIISATYRLLNLTSISLQHRVSNTNWQKGTKFWLNAAISVTPYLVMSYIGYHSQELFIASALRFSSTYILPTIYSNYIKELDLVSGTINFNFKDFCLRNSINTARNLISTITLDAAGVAYYGWDRIFYYYQQPSISIRLCKADNNLGVFKMDNASSIRFPQYVMDELGWMSGKIAADMFFIMLKSFKVITDLRDPINSIFIKELPQEENIQAPQKRSRNRDNSRNRDRRYSNFTRTNEKEHRPVRAIKSASNILSSNIRDKQLEAKTDFHEITNYNISTNSTSTTTPRAPKLKNKNKGKEREQITIPAIKPLPRRRLINIEEAGRPIVPLSGASIHNLNLWGIIGNTGITSQYYDDFQRTLNAANIANRSSGIKFLSRINGTSYYEIRPKNLGSRLIGKMVFGEQEVYNAIKNITGYEKAINLGRELNKYGKEADVTAKSSQDKNEVEEAKTALKDIKAASSNIALIVFEEETKHSLINDKLNKLTSAVIK